MRKISVLLLSAISLLACQKNEKTIINGKFSSYYGMPAKIVGEDIDKDLIIKEDGTFSDTLSVPSNHYTIVAGGAIIPIYLTQGNHLTINADFSENPLKTEFIGKDAKASEYLQSKMKLNSENEATYKEMFAQKPEDFTKSIQEVENKLAKLLEDHASKLEKSFVKLEEKENKFYILGLKTIYPALHKEFTQEEIQMPEAFEQELATLDLDNPKDFKKYPAYKRLVINTFTKNFFELQADKLSEDYPKRWLNFLNKIKNLKTKDLKKEVAPFIAYEMDASNSKESNQMILEILKENITDSLALQQINQKYASLEKLYPGNDVPNFNFENFKGGKTTLESLHGKLVYIDLWATWCVPCLKEIPALQALEKEYHDKDIVFVSISIDQKYEDWKKYLTENKLSGIQLYADLTTENNFAQELEVHSIPYFILLDKYGKIIRVNAPRPSDPQIKKLIDSHL